MSIFRETQGYVRIKIWGSAPERFIVLCSHKSIPLWDVEARGKYVYMNMGLQDFYRCRKLTRKAGIRAVVTERHGLPFLMRKIYKRSFWAAGFILFLAGWLISTNMLLHIELRGNYSISEDVFMDFLRTEGIYIGMWKKDIPIESLEKSIRKQFEAVTWTSGKLNGTVLIIDIKEYDKPIISAQTQEPAQASSLYATADGTITEILVRNGIPLVKKGDSVQKGDLLVDGRVPVYLEDQTVAYHQYYEADADIGIETNLEVHLQLPLVYEVKQYTGRTAEGIYIYLGKKMYRSRIKERNFLYKDVIYEPVSSFGIGHFITKEYAVIEKAYSGEEARNILFQEFEKNNTRILQKGVQILEKDVTIESNTKNWVLSGTIRVIMPAFESRLIETMEETDDSEGL